MTRTHEQKLEAALEILRRQIKDMQEEFRLTEDAKDEKIVSLIRERDEARKLVRLGEYHLDACSEDVTYEVPKMCARCWAVYKWEKENVK